MLDLIAGRHGVENVVGDVAFKDIDFGKSGRHGNGHFNVQRHLVRRETETAAIAVQQDRLDRHVGQTGLGFVGRYIALKKAGIKLQHADHLSGPGLGHARDIGVPEIIAHVGAARPGTQGGLRRRRHLLQHWTRREIIVQPADVQDRDVGADGRLNIRRIKLARLGRVLISPHRHMKRLLDVRSLSAHVHQHTVAVRPGHRQPAGFREINHLLVILFRGAKLGGEFIRREKLAVIGAGGVIQLLEQAVERRLIAQRQADGQVQAGRARQLPDGLQPRDRRGQMAAQHRRARRLGKTVKNHDAGHRQAHADCQ